MHTILMTLLASSTLLLTACTKMTSQYKQSGFEIIAVTRQADNGLQIKYRPQSETLYYSPGANVTMKDGRKKLQFVRCGIKEKCPVDVAGKHLGEQIWQITLQDSPQAIDVVFADGEKTIAP